MKATVKVAGKETQLAVENMAKFRVAKTELVVGIKGGNRNIGFGQSLVIEAWTDDPDTPGNDTDIAAVWSCVNLNTNAPCTNIDNVALALDTSAQPQPFRLTIPAKSLFPFNTYNFRVQARKDVRARNDSILVVVQEEDLPSFEVDFPARSVNLNDYIYLEIADDSEDAVDVD